MAAAASTPPIPGMRMSSSATSGRCLRYSSTACWPLAASATTVMSGCMLTMVVTPTRATRWSSATRMRIGSLMVMVPSLPLRSLRPAGWPGAVRRPAARRARACRSARSGRRARKTRPAARSRARCPRSAGSSLRASMCSLIAIRLAPACFTTLVTASCAMRSRCCSISSGSSAGGPPSRPRAPPPAEPAVHMRVPDFERRRQVLTLQHRGAQIHHASAALRSGCGAPCAAPFPGTCAPANPPPACRWPPRRAATKSPRSPAPACREFPAPAARALPAPARSASANLPQPQLVHRPDQPAEQRRRTTARNHAVS